MCWAVAPETNADRVLSKTTRIETLLALDSISGVIGPTESYPRQQGLKLEALLAIFTVSVCRPSPIQDNKD